MTTTVLQQTPQQKNQKEKNETIDNNNNNRKKIAYARKRHRNDNDEQCILNVKNINEQKRAMKRQFEEKKKHYTNRQVRTKTVHSHTIRKERLIGFVL